MRESYFSDGWCIVLTILCVFMCALGMIRIVDWVKGPKVEACVIKYSDATGNRYEFIGEGSVWR